MDLIFYTHIFYHSFNKTAPNKESIMDQENTQEVIVELTVEELEERTAPGMVLVL